MTLGEFFRAAIRFGNEADPRKGGTAQRSYADSAVLYGDLKRQVRSVLAGIDIEVPELLLADALRKERRIDLALSHHPEGKATAGLLKVMDMQADLLAFCGFPKQAADNFVQQRKQEVERRLLPQNLNRPVDAARLLDLSFACLHTPADNHAWLFISRLIKAKKPSTLGGIVTLLNSLPEYAQAAEIGQSPRVLIGGPNKKAGRVIVEMTGGTEGPKGTYGTLYKNGVRTLICMHLSDDHFKNVNEAGLNVVIAGHTASDSLGLNLLLDKIERISPLEIIAFSGFTRVRRKTGN